MYHQQDYLVERGSRSIIYHVISRADDSEDPLTQVAGATGELPVDPVSYYLSELCVLSYVVIIYGIIAMTWPATTGKVLAKIPQCISSPLFACVMPCSDDVFGLAVSATLPSSWSLAFFCAMFVQLAVGLVSSPLSCRGWSTPAPGAHLPLQSRNWLQFRLMVKPLDSRRYYLGSWHFSSTRAGLHRPLYSGYRTNWPTTSGGRCLVLVFCVVLP